MNKHSQRGKPVGNRIFGRFCGEPRKSLWRSGKMELRTLSLFTGIGGFEVAAKRVGGFRVRKFVEIDPDAQTILRYHFPDIELHSDIRTYYPEKGQFDCIWGGFPCTNTSVAGNREGIKGKSSSLWWEQLRIIRTVQPQFSIIEQPTGVIDRGLRQILASLRMAGYQSEVEIVSAAELGAGHRRERLFIVSYPDQQQWRSEPTSWAEQIRAVVEAFKLNFSWLSVKQSGDDSNHGLSFHLVRGDLSTGAIPREHFSTPTNTEGRIRARYLLGRTVTPAQAAIALRRVLYLNQLRG
jgi:DNA (cytosine-5)-methyltransferase 1